MGLPAAPGGRLNDMRRGFEPVGKLRTGRPGRPKSLLVGPGGELYTWKRPRGRRSPRLGRWAWETKPRLSTNPRLIGDFRKNLVFVEVQFGNSATLYRDFYKFQYGLQNGLLSLSVLIVPVNPKEFFPTRPRSISNMAEYDLALRYFTVLPISVPTMVIGLIAG